MDGRLSHRTGAGIWFSCSSTRTRILAQYEGPIDHGQIIPRRLEALFTFRQQHLLTDKLTYLRPPRHAQSDGQPDCNAAYARNSQAMAHKLSRHTSLIEITMTRFVGSVRRRRFPIGRGFSGTQYFVLIKVTMGCLSVSLAER
jgi:hypothetical protein